VTYPIWTKESKKVKKGGDCFGIKLLARQTGSKPGLPLTVRGNDTKEWILISGFGNEGVCDCFNLGVDTE
jgi:hypothetical protein